MAARRGKKPPKRETLAEAVRREQQQDLVRDLRASLAHEPGETTRAKKLAALRARPRKPTHPLALYLKERGVSREAAADAMGVPRGELERIIREWGRPRDAELIADALGRDLDDLFPTKRPRS